MSDSEKERSTVVGGDDDGGGFSGIDDQKKEMGHVGEGFVRKGKRMSLFRFRKVKKQLHRRKKRPSNPSSTTSGCLGKRLCGGGGCCLCFRQPQTLDSPAESQTSDPNNPEFTCERLKALIEKNDFYSKDCNPHLYLDIDIDIDNLSSCTDEK